VIEDLPLEVGQEEAERGGGHDAEEGDAEERQLRQGELEAAPKVLRGGEGAARLDALGDARRYSTRSREMRGSQTMKGDAREIQITGGEGR